MTEVISVRFRGGCKSYYFDPRGLSVQAGQAVIVETASGSEFAQCSEGNHQVEDQSIVKPLRPVIRVATENDRRTNQLNRQREKEAFTICERKIAAHHLEMKLIRVESNFDGSKIIFFFTAEGRVDFRELVKDLANVFRARIELRQVGVRDEAKMIGGLGICGQPLCCSRFLDEFMPVSIKMAKTQNLSLNPTKISGTCGRLMCCLKYEQNAYEDAMKRMPKNDSFVLTPDGPGNITSVDVLREEAKVKLDDSADGPRTYKGCELQVLRNGKGSREGIEIPSERPKRYVAPETERLRAEERFTPLFRFQEEPAAAPAGGAEAGEKKERSRRRRRGSRNRGQNKEAAPQTRREEGRRETADTVQVEKIAVKVSGDLTAEKKAAADRRAGGERSGRRRGESRGQEKRQAGEQKTAEQKAEGSPSRRRRRRPRRRSGGSGEKSES